MHFALAGLPCGGEHYSVDNKVGVFRVVVVVVVVEERRRFIRSLIMSSSESCSGKWGEKHAALATVYHAAIICMVHDE